MNSEAQVSDCGASIGLQPSAHSVGIQPVLDDEPMVPEPSVGLVVEPLASLEDGEPEVEG